MNKDADTATGTLSAVFISGAYKDPSYPVNVGPVSLKINIPNPVVLKLTTPNAIPSGFSSVDWNIGSCTIAA